MNREEIQKLLGGYATGTLTPEEQQVLFDAALDDQDLFDTLAREQALRDLLRDPACKAQLLAALDQKPLRWYERLAQSWRPIAAVVAMAGVGAIAVVVWQNGRAAKPELMAKYNPPALPSPVAQPPGDSSPAPQALNDRTAEPAAAAKAPAPPATTANKKAKADLDKTSGTPAASEPEADLRKEAKSTASPERKDLARAETETRRSVPGPAVSLGSGFRAAPAPVVGQRELALGGRVAPMTAPPPPPASPAAPKGEAQATQVLQTAPSQSAPAPAQQAQQGVVGGQQLPISGRQADELRLVQNAQNSPNALNSPSNAEQIQVAGTSNASIALAPLAPVPDARTLYYAIAPVNSLPPGSAGGRGGAAGGAFSSARTSAVAARQKTAPQEEKADSVTVKAVGADAKAVAVRPVNLGVRYALLRKTASGDYQPVAPEILKTGDSIEVQITANDAGTLTLRARGADGPWHDMITRHVTAGQSFNSPPLQSADRELEVTLIRSPATMTGAVLRDQVAGIQKQSEGPATYVVIPGPSLQLQFTIPLNYR